jgi:hypothetical protein
MMIKKIWTQKEKDSINLQDFYNNLKEEVKEKAVLAEVEGDLNDTIKILRDNNILYQDRVDSAFQIRKKDLAKLRKVAKVISARPDYDISVGERNMTVIEVKKLIKNKIEATDKEVLEFEEKIQKLTQYHKKRIAERIRNFRIVSEKSEQKFPELR